MEPGQTGWTATATDPDPENPNQTHKKMTKRTTIEIEVEIEYDYDPGTEPYISGAPEDCYPGEDPGVEIQSIELVRKTRDVTGKVSTARLDIVDYIDPDILSSIEDNLIQDGLTE